MDAETGIHEFAWVVVSDLHIGSPFFQAQLFHAFLARLAPETQLILNGDTLDRSLADALRQDRPTLELLWERAERGALVWISGNHDIAEDLELPPFPAITARQEYQPVDGVLVRHGNDFDRLMPRLRVFLQAFKALHRLRTMILGVLPVHVAQYAKKWPRLYQVLRASVARRACSYASARGCHTIVCGHVHYPEVCRQAAICYVNSGCWTEAPAHFVGIEPSGACQLLQWTGLPQAVLQGSSVNLTANESNQP